MLGGLVAVSLSAFVSYRLALHHLAPPATHPRGSASSGEGGCVDFSDARSQVGESGCVSGRVFRVFTSRAGNTFLDFCPDFRDCPFGSVIFSSDLKKFGDLATLAGRQVEIQGLLKVYQGRAEIIIHDPQQIRVLP